MPDIAYILGTLAFFAAALAYVAGCRRLGGAVTATPDAAPRTPEERRP